MRFNGGTGCGGVVCSSCVRSNLSHQEQQGKQGKCPTCRAVCDTRDLIPNASLRDAVQAYVAVSKENGWHMAHGKGMSVKDTLRGGDTNDGIKEGDEQKDEDEEEQHQGEKKNMNRKKASKVNKKGGHGGGPRDQVDGQPHHSASSLGRVPSGTSSRDRRSRKGRRDPSLEKTETISLLSENEEGDDEDKKGAVRGRTVEGVRTRSQNKKMRIAPVYEETMLLEEEGSDTSKEDEESSDDEYLPEDVPNTDTVGTSRVAEKKESSRNENAARRTQNGEVRMTCGSTAFIYAYDIESDTFMCSHRKLPRLNPLVHRLFLALFAASLCLHRT